jgi:hypothetical protein
MSKRNPTRRDVPVEVTPSAPAVPLRARRGWFVVLCLAFAAWVGFLTTLYFKTVRGKEDPHAHQADEEGLSVPSTTTR